MRKTDIWLEAASLATVCVTFDDRRLIARGGIFSHWLPPVFLIGCQRLRSCRLTKNPSRHLTYASWTPMPFSTLSSPPGPRKYFPFRPFVHELLGSNHGAASAICLHLVTVPCRPSAAAAGAPIWTPISTSQFLSSRSEAWRISQAGHTVLTSPAESEAQQREFRVREARSSRHIPSAGCNERRSALAATLSLEA
ncbi:hypothetical protein BU26DRAFT_233765 [Trematosphaeria pertusa]|uniref:Uncharacterized protein n=1 Tax=Trematosphaeria pertusa TaxID=390896 RepID=A0A6A6ITY4_9PLEO|nr:uncharacterized protein BU26DRAFT_233765 [Trematosphaeria pertusa]KAF2254005.1 hypothetical protein BU26DRAFT_233765 [Trematosphaeria pertusa]